VILFGIDGLAAALDACLLGFRDLARFDQSETL
jgi:hypothetical protein